MKIISGFKLLKSTHIKGLVKLIIMLVMIFSCDYFIGKFLNQLYFNQINGNDYRLIYSILKSHEDIIILGDSRAQHHFVPSVIGKELQSSCFNAGRAGGQSIIYHYAIYNSIINRYKPKMFIINISPCELLKGKNNNQLDILSILLPFASQNKAIRQIIKLRGPFESVKSISNIYPFNSKLITLFYHNPNREKDDNGYIPRIGSGPIVQRNEMDDYFNIFDTVKVRYFCTIMKDAEIRGVKIILVISPQYYYLPLNKSIEYIRDYCFMKNIPLIEYSNDINFQKQTIFFNDGLHLNDMGANIFLNLIVKKIKQEYFFNSTVRK
jgi:hypothetical protein